MALYSNLPKSGIVINTGVVNALNSQVLFKYFTIWLPIKKGYFWLFTLCGQKLLHNYSNGKSLCVLQSSLWPIGQLKLDCTSSNDVWMGPALSLTSSCSHICWRRMCVYKMYIAKMVFNLCLQTYGNAEKLLPYY